MTDDPDHGEGTRLGERLRRAREAMDRSPEEMAEELRLTSDQVQALEAEAYHKLPGEAYVRGYLRNYAAALGLPPDEVMAAYEQRPSSPQGDESEGPLIPEPERPLIEHPWRVVWISLALLVVVSVFTIWLVGESREPGLPNGEPAAGGSTETGSRAEGKAEDDGPESPSGDSAPGDGRASKADASAPSGEASAADSSPADDGDGVAATAAQADGGGASTGSAPAPSSLSGAAEGSAGSGETAPRLEGPNLGGPGLEETELPELAGGPEQSVEGASADLKGLRVHTWAKSWIEVADDRGRLLLRRLVPGGRDLRLYGQPPFQVKLGNAAGVQLYFEDAPLPPTGRPGQVVRLTVGADSPTIPESEVAPPEGLSRSGTDGGAAGEDPGPADSGASDDSAPASGEKDTGATAGEGGSAGVPEPSEPAADGSVSP